MPKRDRHWEEDRIRNGWEMPRAALWKRLPIIRVVRCIYHYRRVQQHNHFWGGVGLVASGYDLWVLFGMIRGWERPLK